MSDYTRECDGIVARTDTSTPCRCGEAGCDWTEEDDNYRDKMEAASRLDRARGQA